MASSFLVLTILMLGVTIVNGYDKMKSMETLIEQISLEQEQKFQKLETAQVMSMEAETEAGKVTEETEKQNVSAGTETADQRASAGTEKEEETSSRTGTAAVESSATSSEGAEVEASSNALMSVAEQALAERNYSAEDVSLPEQETSEKTDEVLAAAQRQSQSVYTIKYGDTLADISQKYYGSLEMVEKICELNQIDDANMIVPGQKIVLP